MTDAISEPIPAKPLGGLILCGGQSRRMGRPKHWLPIGDETLLQRVVRLVLTRCSIVVVSAADGQVLPDLPANVETIRDRRPDLGPLQGIASGLEAMAGRVDWAFVTASDAPTLEPSWIDRLVDRSGGVDLVLPIVDGKVQPLSALYKVRESLAASAAMLSEGRSRPRELRQVLATRLIGPDDLREVDPSLATLRNVNTPEQYRQVLKDLGLNP